MRAVDVGQTGQILDGRLCPTQLTQPLGAYMLNRDGLINSDHWATPAKLYEKLDAEFHFDFDPCPLHATFDGLQVEWGNVNFINPPYNRVDKPKFIQKAFDEWRKGKTCVLLIPAATGTKQFHDLILPHAEVRFLRGRVAFEGYNTKGEYVTNNKGKHDSMLVVFRGTHLTKRVPDVWESTPLQAFSHPETLATSQALSTPPTRG